MSEQQFEANIALQDEASWKAACRFLNETHAVDGRPDGVAFWGRYGEVATNSDELTIEINLEFPMSVNFDGLFSFMDKLEDFSDAQFSARFLDTSSGGFQAWRKPEVEIDIAEKRVFLVDIDLDDIEDILEQEEAEIVDSLAEADMIVYEQECQSDALEQAKKQGKPCFTLEEIQDEYWV